MTVTDPSSETPSAPGPETADAGVPNSSSQTTDASAASSTADPSASAPADAPKAEGSDGDADASKPKTLIDAVKATLKSKGTGSSPDDAKTVQPSTQKVGETDPKAAPEAEADVPKEFSKHPAWIRIAKDRDAHKERASQHEQGAKSWSRFNELVKASGFGDERGAEAWMNMGAELNKFGVNDQEKQVLSRFAVATKTDPALALKIIEPIYSALRNIAGEGDLPADLREQVDQGLITDEAARRIARTEASSQIAAARAARADQQAKAEAEARASRETQQAMANEVYSWEQRISSTDPDWQRIAPLVNEQVAILRDARKPQTGADAVKVCEDALALVKKTIGLAPSARTAPLAPPASPSSRRTETPATSVYEHVKRTFA